MDPKLARYFDQAARDQQARESQKRTNDALQEMGEGIRERDQESRVRNLENEAALAKTQ